jgi:hypothetical protein
MLSQCVIPVLCNSVTRLCDAMMPRDAVPVLCDAAMPRGAVPVLYDAVRETHSEVMSAPV